MERYEGLVATAESSWRVADSVSRRVGLSHLGPVERRRLERAIDLLALAQNPGATEAERQGAYRRVLVLVEGLVDVPARARIPLEAATRLQLSAAPEPSAAPVASGA